MEKQKLQVKCGPLGVGRVEVPHPPGLLELVAVRGWHGTPHVHPHEEDPARAYIEVLGAIPDSEVTVTFNVGEPRLYLGSTPDQYQ